MGKGAGCGKGNGTGCEKGKERRLEPAPQLSDTTPMRLRRILPLVFAAACGQRSSDHAASSVIVAFNAGSLARPMRTALDSFAAREQVEVRQESAGSLETARKLTE